jgi:hypothetical protein
MSSCSKHVEDSNKCIIEETVRRVGYLQELALWNLLRNSTDLQ